MNYILILIWIYSLIRASFNAKYIVYVWKHKLAIIKTAWKFGDFLYLPVYFHDLDKIIFMYFLPKNISSWLHDRLALHHFKNIFRIYFYKEMILDWECSRLTKKERQLTAREFFENRKSIIKNKHINKIERVLKEYNL